MKQTAQNVSCRCSGTRKNTYAIKHLTDALLALLQTMPLADISICTLCDTAGVSRASFYRNFETKEDILRTYLHHFFQNWSDAQEKNGSLPLHETLGSLFAYLEQHKAFFLLLQRREQTVLMKDAVISICGPKPEQEKTEAYAKAYVAYTLYGWIEVWLQRGMRESAAEIAALFKRHGC